MAVRGSGDVVELVAKLTLADWFARSGKACAVDLTFGEGDLHDLVVTTAAKKSRTTWNIKASKYQPYRSGLNLMVKWEEVSKPITGYIQCFVHLAEGDLPPHVHFAGVCRRDKAGWLDAVSRGPVSLPNTGGHPGLVIPVSDLLPVKLLLEAATARL